MLRNPPPRRPHHGRALPQIYASKGARRGHRSQRGDREGSSDPSCPKRILRVRSLLPSYIAETLSYAITLSSTASRCAPTARARFSACRTCQMRPSSLYTLRNGVSLESSSNRGQVVLATTASTIATAFVLRHVDIEKLALLQMSTLRLSMFAVVPQVLGCLALVFTTLQEVNDPLVLAGFVLALALNIVLGAQLYLYWDNTNRESREKDEKVNVAHERKKLGNGSGRRGGAAVSSGVEPEASMRGRGALGVSYSILPPSSGFSPSSISSSGTPSAPPGPSTLPSPSAYPASSRLSPAPSSTTEKTSAYAESQSPLHVGTPPLRSGTPSGRKWSRKVD